MPTKYIILVTSANERYITTMKVFTSRIIELAKLQETKMQTVEIVKI
jgi:hypothetical protein